MPAVHSGEVVLADKGVYIAQLCAIDAKTAKQKNDQGIEQDSTFWIWKFRGFKEKDKARAMCPVEVTTGCTVSTKDSQLKSLLMSAFPEMTPEEMKTFNTDEMIGKAWRIKVGVAQKPNGNDKNVILDIEACDEDPFADE
jgi:hypothetical protein